MFTFSVHGQKNFPFHKERSDLDIALPDGAADEQFLEAVERAVQHSIDRANAEIAIYLAGADPFIGDSLGRMAVSKAGLAQRDRLVLDQCRSAGLPVAITMAGGYAKNVEESWISIFKLCASLELTIIIRSSSKVTRHRLFLGKAIPQREFY